MSSGCGGDATACKWMPVDVDEEVGSANAAKMEAISQRRRPAAWMVPTAIAAFVVFAFSGVALLSTMVPRRPTRKASPRQLTAASLLSDPEVHAVAADNILRVGVGLVHEQHREPLRATIAESFRGVHDHLRLTAPEVADSLEQVHLSEEDRTALLQALSLTVDLEVQALGLEVARAIRESLHQGPSMQREALLRGAVLSSLSNRLAPKSQDVASICAKLPSTLRQTHKTSLNASMESSSPWELTFDPSNLRVVASTSDDWEHELIMLASQAPADETSTDRPWKGVLEQVRRRLMVQKLAMAPLRDFREPSPPPPADVLRQAGLDNDDDDDALAAKWEVAPIRDLRQPSPVPPEDVLRQYALSPANFTGAQVAESEQAESPLEVSRMADAIVEQARAHLGIVGALSSWSATQVMGLLGPSVVPGAKAADPLAAPTSCDLRIEDAEEEERHSRRLLCALKFGSMGLDAVLSSHGHESPLSCPPAW